MLVYKRLLIMIGSPKVVGPIVNRQIGVGDSKYMIFYPLLTDRVHDMTCDHSQIRNRSYNEYWTNTDFEWTE